MFKVGITGTRRGMTKVQWQKFVEACKTNLPEQWELYHGDCIGVDDQAATGAKEIAAHSVEIFGYPCDIEHMRAHNKSTDVWFPAQPPLERNHDIVDATDVLWAFPKEKEEIMRSGTWATIRYARKCNKQIVYF